MAKEQTEKQRYVRSLAKEIYNKSATGCKTQFHSITYQQALKEAKQQAQLRRPNWYEVKPKPAKKAATTKAPPKDEKPAVEAKKTVAPPKTIKVGSSRKGNVTVPYNKKKTSRTASNPKDFLTYHKEAIAAERKRVESFLADAKIKYANILNLYKFPKKDREEYVQIYSKQQYSKEFLLNRVRGTDVKFDKNLAKGYNSGITQHVNNAIRQYGIALAMLDIIEQKNIIKKQR